MPEGDEFDAEGAASRALGDVADVGDGVNEMVDGDDAADAIDDGDGSDPTDSDDGGGGVSGVLPASASSALRSMLLAPERGPTRQTFEGAGVDEDKSLMLDGATDWLLDVTDLDDVGETIGPVGKIALGISKRSGDGGDDGGGGDGADAADQEGSGESVPDEVGGVPST